MLTDSLLVFGNQENLELVRGIRMEILIGFLTLFLLGQILRSAALFSLNRSFEKNELLWSFIPLYRYSAYLKTIANSKGDSKKRVPAYVTAIVTSILLLGLAGSLLLVSSFELFISILIILVFFDLLSRFLLLRISKTFKKKISILWILPLIGSIAILFRKEKDIFVSL